MGLLFLRSSEPSLRWEQKGPERKRLEELRFTSTTAYASRVTHIIHGNHHWLNWEQTHAALLEGSPSVCKSPMSGRRAPIGVHS